MDVTIGSEDRFEVNVMRVKGIETVEIKDEGVKSTVGAAWRKIIIGNLEINLFGE